MPRTDQHELYPAPNTTDLFEKLRIPNTILPPGADPVQAGLTTTSGDLTIAGSLVLATSHSPGLLLHYRRYEAGRQESLTNTIRPIEDFRAPGPLSACIPELAEGLLAHAPVKPHDRGLARQLFDELLVNAVGHRSFAPEHCDEPVVIDHFTDCVRIVSPGPLHEQVALDEGKLDGRWSRNPKLMALLARQGLARLAGLGLAWSHRLAPELGYSVHHEADDRCVNAVLTVDPEKAIRADLRLQREERRLRLPAGLVERRIVEILSDGDPRSRKDLQQKLGLPLSTVNAALRRLVKLGHIETTEKRDRSPKQRYRRAQR